MSGRGIQVHQDSSRKLPGVVREDPEFFGQEIDISRARRSMEGVSPQTI